MTTQRPTTLDPSRLLSDLRPLEDVLRAHAETCRVPSTVKCPLCEASGCVSDAMYSLRQAKVSAEEAAAM
jgi:hypothetical protein